MKTRTNTNARRRTSVKPSTGEITPESKPEKPSKSSGNLSGERVNGNDSIRDVQPTGVPKTKRTRAAKAEKKDKPVKTVEPLRYDFVDSYRGSMTVLKNNATQKARVRWITITEWPKSLIEAYNAGILTGEAEILAKGLKAMSHPFRQALVRYRKPTEVTPL